MIRLSSRRVQIESEAARAIAAGMREVARVDGVTQAEEDLIAAFEADLPGGPPDHLETADLGALRTPAEQEAFMKSLLLVAFADGQLSHGERAVIQQYADALGWGQDDVGAAVLDVASALLGRFAGVKVFREQVVQIGRSMGLDDETILLALG